MFFKRKKNINTETENELFKSTQLRHQHMPIATLDNTWHQLISDIKTPQIVALEKELTNLLKEQGKLNTDHLEYTRLKKEMLDTILNLTHEAFELESKDAAKKIDNQQKMVLKINDNLEEIEEQLEGVPKKIQEVNGLLLGETVQLCYKHINTYKAKSEKLDEEIQVIRCELMNKTESKKAYDQQAEQLYQYLHQLIGPGFMEKLDNKYWENQNDSRNRD